MRSELSTVRFGKVIELSPAANRRRTAEMGRQQAAIGYNAQGYNEAPLIRQAHEITIRTYEAALGLPVGTSFWAMGLSNGGAVAVTEEDFPHFPEIKYAPQLKGDQVLKDARVQGKKIDYIE